MLASKPAGRADTCRVCCLQAVNLLLPIRPAIRGVAMGWTGVDVSTPRLPEIVSEIDANPISIYSGSSVRECVFYVFF